MRIGQRTIWGHPFVTAGWVFWAFAAYDALKRRGHLISLRIR